MRSEAGFVLASVQGGDQCFQGRLVGVSDFNQCLAELGRSHLHLLLEVVLVTSVLLEESDFFNCPTN